MKQGFFILFSALTLFSCTNVQKPTPTLITLQNCHSFKGTFVYKGTANNSGVICSVNSCNFKTGIYAKSNSENIEFSNGTLADPVTYGLPSDSLFLHFFLDNGFLVKQFKKSSYVDTYELRDSCSSSLMSIDTSGIYYLINYSIE